MKLRPLVPQDITALDELWKKYWSAYSLPTRSNAIIDAVTINPSGQIVGYGQVKLFAEAMLFLDPTMPRRERAISVRLLMSEAFRGVRSANIEQIYAFIKDPEFVKLIVQRYGFEPVVEPGQLLMKELE